MNFHNIADNTLPFNNCSPFFISCQFQTGKKHLIEKLENNNFSKEMIKHISKFSKNNYSCKYYDKDNINSLSNSHHTSALKVIHININSIGKHGLELASYLEHLNINYDVIMLTETRETSVGIVKMHFPNYDIFIKNPDSPKGGACILTARDRFKNIQIIQDDCFNLGNKCSCNQCEIDDIWITLESNNKNILIGCIYRHPKAASGISHFTENLNVLMNNVKDNTTAIIAGDFNIDLINTDNNHVEHYTNTILQNSFIPCISIPTRVTHHSASIIDHILLKTPKKLIQTKVSAGNLITDISDHLPNILFIDLVIQKYQDRPMIRIFSPNKIEKYRNGILNERPLITKENKVNLDENDPQKTYKEFDTNFHKLYDKYFPLIKKSRKQAKDKPFITNGIKESIKSRNALFKKYLDEPSEINKQNWKNKRNCVVQILRKAETDHYASFIKKHSDNSKQLWKRFGNVLGKSKSNNSSTEKLLINNQCITDQKTITSEFNKYFCSVGEKLASKIRDTGIDNFKQYLNQPTQQSLFLTNITINEITIEINNLEQNKSPGHDEFTAKFLKISHDIVAPILSDIFNICIKKGEYPDLLKIAKVLPIYKKGSKSSVSNYRPISVLSCINKIFEKLLAKRIYSFLEKQHILYKFQYGFRTGHSTNHALIEISDKIKLAINDNELMCGLFLDLSKAFDTVNHNILISKLNHYGIRGPTLNLLKSYLTNRKQYVKIGKQKSELRNISCGVPQGSVLGPLLFILYINDLHKACTTGDMRIFADDTTVFFKCKNKKDITSIGMQIMTQLNMWFKANRLTLNSEKSNFVVFRSRQNKITNLPGQIHFENTCINRSESAKYLGVILDEHLTWNQQITEVCNKLKRYFKLFYCIRNLINTDQVKIIYYALIYSRIKYGISIFGLTSNERLKRIQVLQNKLLKVLLAKSYRYSTNLLHNELKILKVKDIAKLDALTFIHNYFNNKLPSIFDNYFTLVSEIHNRNTRRSEREIYINTYMTNAGISMMKSIGAKIWNETSNSTKLIQNIKTFRKTIIKNTLY